MYLHEVSSSSTECCDNNVSERCKFLCTGNPTTKYFEDNVECAEDHIKFIFCNVKKLKILDDLEEGFKALPETKKLDVIWNNFSTELEKLLSDQNLVGDVTIVQLFLNIRQYLLTDVVKAVDEATHQQFNGILQNIVNFNPTNLKKIIEQMGSPKLFRNVTRLQGIYWKAHGNELLLQHEAGINAMIEIVVNWSTMISEQIRMFLQGITLKDIFQLLMSMFNNILSEACHTGMKFSIEKTFLSYFLNPPSAVFGNLDEWVSGLLEYSCKITGMFSQHIEKYIEINIINAISNLKKYFAREDAMKIIVKKMNDVMIIAKNWNRQQLKNVGKLIEILDTDEINNMDPSNLTKFISDAAEKYLANETQFTSMYTNVAEQVTVWPDELVSIVSNLINKTHSLIPENFIIKPMEQILNETGFQEWQEKQNDFIYDKVKFLEDFPNFSEKNSEKLNSIVKAFLSSDAARMIKRSLYTTIPLVGYTIAIGEPIGRYLIKVYKEESKSVKFRSFGNFIDALTKHDFEKEVVNDIIGNLDGLKKLYPPHPKQLKTITTLQKIFHEIGKTNTKENVWSTGPSKKELSSVKEIVNVVRDRKRQQMTAYPIDALGAIIKVLGKDWKEEDVLGILSRMKSHWDEKKISITILTDFKVEALANFLQSFILKEISQMKSGWNSPIFKKLAELLKMDSDDIHSRAEYVYQSLRNANGGTLDAMGLDIMGTVISGMSPDKIKAISNETLLINMNGFGEIADIPQENFMAILKDGEKIVKKNIERWSNITKSIIERALKTLNGTEIVSLGTDYYKMLFQYFASLGDVSSSHGKILSDSLKRNFRIDINSSPVNTYRKLALLVAVATPRDVKALNKEVLNCVQNWIAGISNETSRFSYVFEQRLDDALLKGKIFPNETELRRVMRIVRDFIGDDYKSIEIEPFRKLLDLVKWGSNKTEILLGKGAEYLVSSPNSTEFYHYLDNLSKSLTSEFIHRKTTESFQMVISMLNKMGNIMNELGKTWNDVFLQKMYSIVGEIVKEIQDPRTDVKKQQ